MVLDTIEESGSRFYSGSNESEEVLGQMRQTTFDQQNELACRIMPKMPCILCLEQFRKYLACYCIMLAYLNTPLALASVLLECCPSWGPEVE